jgi:hypothetical protein
MEMKDARYGPVEIVCSCRAEERSSSFHRNKGSAGLASTGAMLMAHRGDGRSSTNLMLENRRWRLSADIPQHHLLRGDAQCDIPCRFLEPIKSLYSAHTIVRLAFLKRRQAYRSRHGLVQLMQIASWWIVGQSPAQPFCALSVETDRRPATKVCVKHLRRIREGF